MVAATPRGTGKVANDHPLGTPKLMIPEEETGNLMAEINKVMLMLSKKHYTNLYVYRHVVFD